MDGRLMVPMRDAGGKLWSVQHIGGNGFKQFHEGSRVAGRYHVVGDATTGPIMIAEGYATAATVHELSGLTAVVAFNAGNLVEVTQAVRALHPGRQLFVAADNDHQLEARGKPNVGALEAAEAAEAVEGIVAMPRFAPGDPGSDWNDVAVHQGKDEARRQLHLAMLIAARSPISPDAPRAPTNANAR